MVWLEGDAIVGLCVIEVLWVEIWLRFSIDAFAVLACFDHLPKLFKHFIAAEQFAILGLRCASLEFCLEFQEEVDCGIYHTIKV